MNRRLDLIRLASKDNADDGTEWRDRLDEWLDQNTPLLNRCLDRWTTELLSEHREDGVVGFLQKYWQPNKP